MTDQPRVFTARAEAQYAEDLRTTRDRTDADIRSDYIRPVSQDEIDGHRARGTAVRARWEREAIVSAVHQALNHVDESARRYFPSRDYDDEMVSIVAGDYEGAQITITVLDLVAEVTVTLPPTQ